MKLPRWERAKKDGTRDKRVAINNIVWRKNILYIENFILMYEDPLEMYSVIRQLRNNGVQILMCKEEKKKYARVQQQKNEINQIKTIDDLTIRFKNAPFDFEKFCARLCEEKGYQVTITPPVNDGGYDLLIRKNDVRIIVECKCYAYENKIGRPLIQKLVGANQKIHADGMVFITTSDFTKEARDFSDDVGVELINGKKLISILSENQDNISPEVVESEWMLTDSEILNLLPWDLKREAYD